MRAGTLWMLPPILFLACGCGASRQTAYLADAASAKSVVAGATETTAKQLWDERENPAKLRQALELYEQLAKAQPTRRDLLERLSRGYYLLAYGYETEEEKILAAYDAGARWGERILGLSSRFKERIAASAKDYEALDVTTKEDVAGVYWAYANLGKWAVLKGFTTVLRYKSKLKAFVDRAHELDPSYYHAAADRGLGAFYAKAPSFAGGDLKKSRAHFDSALKIAPGYFGTKMLMAEYYAVKTQDRKLFERLLDEVIKGDPNALPDVVPIQKVDQRKARDLLATADELFE